MKSESEKVYNGESVQPLNKKLLNVPGSGVCPVEGDFSPRSRLIELLNQVLLDLEQNFHEKCRGRAKLQKT
jgi:hypothetical protein